MAVKLTPEGILIYCTMAAYLAATVALMFEKKKLGWTVYTLGFTVAVISFVFRWHHVGHVPMQNLFEVFLCLGMLVLPISLFCRGFMRVGGTAADCMIGFIVLFPAGFVFNADPQRLPPALQSGLFIPHVAAYMIAYMILAKAAVQGLGQLLRKAGPNDDQLISYEVAAYKMVRLGFPLLTLGLVLGAIWGKIAWGDYWNWDPKELWSFVTWLIYVGYFHFRYVSGRKFPQINSALVLSGFLAIVITLLWVNLSRIFPGLHSYAS